MDADVGLGFLEMVVTLCADQGSQRICHKNRSKPNKYHNENKNMSQNASKKITTSLNSPKKF